MPSNDPICLVPARGTEPGLPKQNFKRLDGKPLVAHIIETALTCEVVEAVFVSTESEALAEIAREYGARVPFLRPAHLAAEDVLLHEVVGHTLDRLVAEGIENVPDGQPVIVLQPNVPFCRPDAVSAAIDTFDRGHDAVVSVVEERGFYWQSNGEVLEPRFDERTVSDDLEPFYRETGAINVTTPRLIDRGTRVGDEPGYVVTDRLSALTVDSVLDLWMAERIAAGPRIVFRVDGGSDIGMGHVSRCLTLAAELDDSLRCEIEFVSSTEFPTGIEAIHDAGYSVRTVEDDHEDAVVALDPDIAFFDVLDTADERMRRLHETAAAVVNLEDIGGGLVHADCVINALYRDVSNGSNHFAGADYFVLREEFDDPEVRLPPTAEHVLVTFGGSDPQRLSLLACRAVADDTDREYRLVVGPGWDAWAELERTVAECSNVEVLADVDDMGSRMGWADLAVASGGRTAYELAATGTPTLVIAQNRREHERMHDLGERGVVEYLGRAGSISKTEFRAAVDGLAANRGRRRRLSERGRAFVDGLGTRRILDLVHELLFG
jgi:spore coat polysaccharide biosynthesis predicted glycosyltransferase SpsG/CMP-N-acetylneuraminic acid synthetase